MRRAGEAIALTATEFELLRYLMRNPRRVLSKAQILDRVWNYDFGGQANVVELYISYLRKKIDAGRAADDPHPARRRLCPQARPSDGVRSRRPGRCGPGWSPPSSRCSRSSASASAWSTTLAWRGQLRRPARRASSPRSPTAASVPSAQPASGRDRRRGRTAPGGARRSPPGDGGRRLRLGPGPADGHPRRAGRGRARSTDAGTSWTDRAPARPTAVARGRRPTLAARARRRPPAHRRPRRGSATTGVGRRPARPTATCSSPACRSAECRHASAR